MEKKCVHVPDAPAALGPYSHAVKAGGFLFLSGQTPLNPADCAVMRGTIEEETRRVLDNIKIVLEGSGSSLDQVVRVTAYLDDMENFAAFNAVYKEYFPADAPARTCFQAGRLPLDVKVEVDAIAIVPE